MSHTVDLVLATAGRRPAELRRFVDSLADQRGASLRLILVDQSAGGIDVDALALERLPASLVVRDRDVGVSRARNAGLACADADVVAFPDDDCWYPPDLVARATALIGGRPGRVGVCARSLDDRGRPSNLRWDTRPGRVDRFNCWSRAIAYGVFLRRRAVIEAGGFDPSLCTPFSSGGETDLVLRLLAHGELWYDPSLTVHHPQQEPTWTKDWAEKGYRYGIGAGTVMRRHRYPLWFVAWRIAQVAAVSPVFLLRGMPAAARFYWAMARGRLRGWLASGDNRDG